MLDAGHLGSVNREGTLYEDLLLYRTEQGTEERIQHQALEDRPQRSKSNREMGSSDGGLKEAQSFEGELDSRSRLDLCF